MMLMMMLSCFSFPTVFPAETSYSPTKRAGSVSFFYVLDRP